MKDARPSVLRTTNSADTLKRKMTYTRCFECVAFVWRLYVLRQIQERVGSRIVANPELR